MEDRACYTRENAQRQYGLAKESTNKALEINSLLPPQGSGLCLLSEGSSALQSHTSLASDELWALCFVPCSGLGWRDGPLGR